MTTNPVVKFVFHNIFCCFTSYRYHFISRIQSKKARPLRYAVTNNQENSTWSSRNMAVLGTILMLFLIIHLRSFWYEMHFGDMPYQYLEDGTKIKDLYLITTSAFQNPIYTIFYVFAWGSIFTFKTWC